MKWINTFMKKLINTLLLPKDPDVAERKTKPIYYEVGAITGLLSAALGFLLTIGSLQGIIPADWSFVCLCFTVGASGFAGVMIIETLQWLKRRV